MALKAAWKKKNIELNAKFKHALNLLANTSKNVFITGRAGTGKSTLLDYFRNNTKKELAVLAPTGVAALNVQGQTIHSFFRFKPNVVLKKIKKIGDKKGSKKSVYKNLDMIIIDEISMVRADLLDCVDKFLRLNGKDSKKPFGGIQMVFIGDLYQLPPVVASSEKEIFKTDYQSQYFFDAKVFNDFKIELVELEKIYRQEDKQFIDMLNKIRNNTATEEDLRLLNDRYIEPPADDDFYIYLTTTNKMADEVNNFKLNQLRGKSFSFHGQISGDFERKQLPTQEVLELKAGSQVMFLNNDSGGRWVNGTIGKITDVDAADSNAIITVELENGELVEVEPYTWNIFRYVYNLGKGGLDTEKMGSFTQFPLRLAWAITIHKSQGKTFDKAVIDIGYGTFSHGQLYVALSRCTSLEGMILKKPIEKKHIWMDWRITNFLTDYQYDLSEKNCSYEDKVRIIEDAIGSKQALDIVYLKTNDEKTKRTITPQYIDEMWFKGRSFEGLRAFCHIRQDERTFRIARILEINLKL